MAVNASIECSTNPDPKELVLLAKTGLSSSRQYDFALANAVLKRIEARSLDSKQEDV